MSGYRTQHSAHDKDACIQTEGQIIITNQRVECCAHLCILMYCFLIFLICCSVLYTSPHLVSLTERFRLNATPISPQLFLKHFWAVWDGLVSTRAETDGIE